MPTIRAELKADFSDYAGTWIVGRGMCHGCRRGAHFRKPKASQKADGGIVFHIDERNDALLLERLKEQGDNFPQRLAGVTVALVGWVDCVANLARIVFSSDKVYANIADQRTLEENSKLVPPAFSIEAARRTFNKVASVLDRRRVKLLKSRYFSLGSILE